MRILILHSNDSFAQTRRTSFNHAFALIKYAPEYEYVLQCFGQPVTDRIRNSHFDIIVLDTTFLCWRWAEPRNLWLDRILDEYSFVERSDAVKIALPQDEYDHSELLDEWLSTWKVDLIYSVCFEHRDQFYKRAKVTADIVEGLTGFIDDADIELMSRFALPFEQRDIDVGYRARNLPAYFGRFGRLKAEIGERFHAQMMNKGLRLDISTRPEDSFAGDDWLKFLGRSKFTLGCESGSSLLDPRGDIRRCVKSQNPSRSFEDLERQCFPDQDMKFVYSAISPRLFEAAIANSCQILVPGRYANALQPDEHYIALAADLSNAEEVLDKIHDTKSNIQRIRACYEVLVENPAFRYTSFVSDMLKRAHEVAVKKGGSQWDQKVLQLSVAELRHAYATAVFKSHLDHVEEIKELRKSPPPEVNLFGIFIWRVRQVIRLLLRA